MNLNKLKRRESLQAGKFVQVCFFKLNETFNLLSFRALVANIAAEQNKLVQIEFHTNEKKIKLNSLTDMALEGRQSLSFLMTKLEKQILQKSASPSTTTRYEKMIKGYHGQVIDLVVFDREAELDQPVEALLKNRIFSHVVNDEEVANEILHEIKERDLKGSFNFILLNRLQNTKRHLPDDSNLNEKVVSMINYIKYDKCWNKLIEFIFGGKYICQDFETCCVYLEASYNCDFVTVDGDVIDRNGVIITYGRKNKKTRRMLFNDWKSLVNQHDKILKKLKGYINKLKINYDEANQKAIELVEMENIFNETNANLEELERFLVTHSFEYFKQLDKLRNQIEENNIMASETCICISLQIFKFYFF